MTSPLISVCRLFSTTKEWQQKSNKSGFGTLTHPARLFFSSLSPSPRVVSRLCASFECAANKRVCGGKSLSFSPGTVYSGLWASSAVTKVFLLLSESVNFHLPGVLFFFSHWLLWFCRCPSPVLQGTGPQPFL